MDDEEEGFPRRLTVLPLGLVPAGGIGDWVEKNDTAVALVVGVVVVAVAVAVAVLVDVVCDAARREEEEKEE